MPDPRDASAKELAAMQKARETQLREQLKNYEDAGQAEHAARVADRLVGLGFAKAPAAAKESKAKTTRAKTTAKRGKD